MTTQNKQHANDTPCLGEENESPADQEISHDRSKEIGGAKGPEPTRYGDWEKNGRCIDF